MKIQTEIPARKDGTLSLNAPSGATYEFVLDEHGRLVTDIEHEDDLAHVLSLGAHFSPADEADFSAARELLSSQSDEGDGVGDDDDEPDEEDAGNGGLPLESNTPAKAARVGRKVKAA